MSDEEMKKPKEGYEEGISEESDEKQEQLQLKGNKITYQSFSQLLFLTLTLCLSSFYFGYNLAYFGTFQFSTIVSIFNIEIEKGLAEGLLQGCIPVGGGIGAALSLLLLNNLSRRKSILLINSIALCAGFTLFIHYPWLLFIGRFVQGICVGLYSAIIPLIIKQFSPNEISGTLGTLNQLFIAFGVFFSYLFQFILLKFSPESENWGLISGFTILTVLLQTVLLVFKYTFETPRYLLQKNQQNECEKVLKWIYLEEHVKEIFNILKGNLENSTSNSGDSKSSKRRIFIAIHLAVLQQFVGINSVVGYGSKIVGEVIPDYKNLIPVFLNSEQVIAALVTTYLLAKFGRKTILQIGTLVAGLSLVLIAVGFLNQSFPDEVKNSLIIIGLVIFMANFGLSLGPIVWLYIPEIVEPEIIPFSTLSNWASAALIMIFFPIMSQKLGNQGPLFIFFSIWSFVSFFLNQSLLIETKGKTEQQIYDEFQNAQNK